jgi:hypothetical protein
MSSLKAGIAKNCISTQRVNAALHPSEYSYAKKSACNLDGQKQILRLNIVAVQGTEICSRFFAGEYPSFDEATSCSTEPDAALF